MASTTGAVLEVVREGKQLGELAFMCCSLCWHRCQQQCCIPSPGQPIPWPALHPAPHSACSLTSTPSLSPDAFAFCLPGMQGTWCWRCSG